MSAPKISYAQLENIMDSVILQKEKLEAAAKLRSGETSMPVRTIVYFHQAVDELLLGNRPGLQVLRLRCTNSEFLELLRTNGFLPITSLTTATLTQRN